MDESPILLLLNIRSLPFDALTVLLPEMPPLRREKILALRREDDRLRSLAAGLLCREALAARGLSDALIRYAADGRPYVEGAAACGLSLSHSGDYALCLLDCGPCAVDVQEHVGVPEAIVKTGFTPAERAYCDAAPDREAAFFTLWCRKECKAKLRPYAHLREIDSLTPEPGYSFVPFPLPGYSCVAYTRHPEQLRLQVWRGKTEQKT